MSAQLRELAHRSNDGIDVRLVWDEADDGVLVLVCDTKAGERFQVRVAEGESPLDVFHHPYAYAAWRASSPPRLRRRDQSRRTGHGTGGPRRSRQP